MYFRFMVSLHLPQQIANSFILLHHFLVMTVALHRCPGRYLIAHQYIDLQVLPFMVPQLQPMHVVFHERVIFPVFLGRPVVVWVFFLLWIIDSIRVGKRTRT